MPSQPEAKRLARQLIEAAETCQPIEPFSAQCGAVTPETASKIRAAWLEAKQLAGHRPVGKKVAAIRRGWRGHAQVLEGGWGHILDSTVLLDGSELPASHLIQPRIEAEFAFLLARDLAGPGITAAHILAATEGVCAGFEIIDSRFRPKAPTPEDSTADNGSHAYAVFGARLLPASELDLAAAAVSLEINGEVKGTGTGANVAGHPAHALVALANQQPLRAGEIVLTGSVAGAFPIRSGDRVLARFEGLGSVSLNVV